MMFMPFRKFHPPIPCMAPTFGMYEAPPPPASVGPCMPPIVAMLPPPILTVPVLGPASWAAP